MEAILLEASQRHAAEFKSVWDTQTALQEQLRAAQESQAASTAANDPNEEHLRRIVELEGRLAAATKATERFEWRGPRIPDARE